jgi:hypothetical protein
MFAKKNASLWRVWFRGALSVKQDIQVMLINREVWVVMAPRIPPCVLLKPLQAGDSFVGNARNSNLYQNQTSWFSPLCWLLTLKMKGKRIN